MTEQLDIDLHSTVWWEDMEREAILAELGKRRRLWIETLRRALIACLARKRERGEPEIVTADDAREIFERWDDVPPAVVVSRNFLGNLFRHPDWEATGQSQRSRTPGRHGSRVMQWRYNPNGAS